MGISLLIIIFLSGYLIYERTKYTTYQETLKNYIGEGEIIKIRILHSPYIYKPEENYYADREVIIEDKDFFKKFITEPSNMKIRKVRDIPPVDYHIAIYTEQSMNPHWIYMSDGYLTIDGLYKINGDNKLKDLIEKADLNWNIDEW